MNIIEFATSRPVILKKARDEIARLRRLETSLYLRGDSIMEQAEQVFLAAGFKLYQFKCYESELPPGAPLECIRLMRKSHHYNRVSSKFYSKALTLERELYGAQTNHRTPKGAA